MENNLVHYFDENLDEEQADALTDFDLLTQTTRDFVEEAGVTEADLEAAPNHYFNLWVSLVHQELPWKNSLAFLEKAWMCGVYPDTALS